MSGSQFKFTYASDFNSVVTTLDKKSIEELLGELQGKQWFVAGDIAIQISQIKTVEKLR